MTTESANLPDDQRRRQQRAWYFYDWANSAFSTTVVTVFLGPYLTTLAEDAAGADGRVGFILWDVRPGTYFSLLVSFSVVLQVLVLPVTGAIADRSGHRRQLLATFAAIGSVATMTMVVLTDGRFVLGGFLLVVANLAFGMSVVVYNAFLPQIATADERDRVSSHGWALGYLGGAVLLVVNLALYLGHDAFGLSEREAVRISLLSAGVWWAVFTIIPVRGLRSLPRPDNSDPEPAPSRGGGVLTSGFRQLGGTLRDIRRYPQTLLFLFAYLLYNDGIQTVIALAAVYIEKELLLDTSVSISVILLVQIVAFAGALALGRLAARWGAKRVILHSLVVWGAILVVAFYLPQSQAMGVYGIAVAIGFVLGGSQALSRSLYSQLIPRSREAEYFAFYEISERGTSWLGTLTFALTYEVSGSYRVAIVVLVAFFIVGGLLLHRVQVGVAIDAVGNLRPAVL
ncbi:MAG: MFS transporter [Actinomycetia bacterium]|nr:MFS transporter [Actinomycetes bacterium]